MHSGLASSDVPEFALGIVLGHALRRTPDRPRSFVVDSLREASLAGALLLCTFALGSGLASRALGVALADRIAIESGILAPIFALLVWQIARGQGLLQKLLSGSRSPCIAWSGSGTCPQNETAPRLVQGSSV